jgi:hypothetical protein
MPQHYKKKVPIIENNICQDMFEHAGHKKKILSSFLCAGYANGQKDSCEVSRWWIFCLTSCSNHFISSFFFRGKFLVKFFLFLIDFTSFYLFFEQWFWRSSCNSTSIWWSLSTDWYGFTWNQVCITISAGCLYENEFLQTVD